MNNIITIENLEKIYETTSEKLSILSNLNMKVRKGQKCVIVGKSGSGKSTLLNIIGGLDTATSGKVFVDNKLITSCNDDELTDYRQNYLGLIFQFHYLLKDFSALENVFLPAYMAGKKKKDALDKAMMLLKDVGLEDRVNHYPGELSGGERQRVAVARCLINDPELILADEPTGNLDPVNAGYIGDLLFSMVDKYNKTLLLVTHDMNLAARGDVKYYIQNGQLVEKKS